MTNTYFTAFFELFFAADKNIDFIYAELEYDCHTTFTKHYSVFLWLHYSYDGKNFCAFGWQYNLKDFNKFDIVEILQSLTQNSNHHTIIKTYMHALLPFFFKYIKEFPFNPSLHSQF